MRLSPGINAAILMAVTASVLFTEAPGAAGSATVRPAVIDEGPASTQAVYIERCGIGVHSAQCEVQTISESLDAVDGTPVTQVPRFDGGCGPANDYGSAEVSSDGAVVVTFQDGVATHRTCSLVVTRLDDGSQSVVQLSKSVRSQITGFGYQISPSGAFAAVFGYHHGVRVLNLGTGSVRNVDTGFDVSGVAWNSTGTRLLVDGPSIANGGRGPRSATDALFAYTLDGKRLHRWSLFTNTNGYLASTPFIAWPSPHTAVVSLDVGYDPSFGGTAVPGGTYVLHLAHGRATRSRIARAGAGIAEPLYPLATDRSRSLVAYEGRKKYSICIAHYTRPYTPRCTHLQNSAIYGGVAGIAPPPATLSTSPGPQTPSA